MQVECTTARCCPPLRLSGVTFAGGRLLHYLRYLVLRRNKAGTSPATEVKADKGETTEADWLASVAEAAHMHVNIM